MEQLKNVVKNEYLLDACGHGVQAAMIATLVSQAMSLDGNLVKTVFTATGSYQINMPLQILEQLDSEFPFARFNKPACH